MFRKLIKRASILLAAAILLGILAGGWPAGVGPAPAEAAKEQEDIIVERSVPIREDEPAPAPAPAPVPPARKEINSPAEQTREGDRHYNDKNYSQALDWYQRAAAQGYAPARNMLGLMYLRGEGTAKDPYKSAEMFRAAADQEFAPAQVNLGLAYANSNHGVKENHEEAFKWFQRAARHGDINAYFYLGFMYENGKGVPADSTEAQKWYKLAADQGHGEARKKLGQVVVKVNQPVTVLGIETFNNNGSSTQSHMTAFQEKTVRYIGFRIKLRNDTNEKLAGKLGVKYIDTSGTLRKGTFNGEPSPEGYSFMLDVKLDPAESKTIEEEWGNSGKSVFELGTHTMEFWWGGQRIGTARFDIVPQRDPVQPLEDARSFAEGLAAVKFDGSYGFIDKNGITAIKPQFQKAWSFSEGLAEVMIRDDQGRIKAGYVGKNGQIAAFQFDNNKRFSEGLAPVKIGERWGYIDKAGNVVIQPQFKFAEEFAEGLARVYVDYEEGYIDKSGRKVIPLQFDVAKHFSEGLAVVRVNGKSGFINKEGQMVVEPQFKFAEDFSEGLARVYTINDEGFIDRNGQLVISMKYDRAQKFSDGLAAVKINGKYGYIDKNGQIVIEPKFALAREFKQGLAAVKIDGKWGFIDKRGEIVIAPRYDLVRDFSEGLAAVVINDGCGYVFINRYGDTYISQPLAKQ